MPPDLPKKVTGNFSPTASLTSSTICPLFISTHTICLQTDLSLVNGWAGNGQSVLGLINPALMPD